MIWLFPAYIAAVVIGLSIRKRYRRRHPAKPPQTIHGKILLGLGKAGVAMAISYVGIAVMFISFIIYEYDIFFTPSCIENIEDSTGIVISDDVKPVRFIRMFGGPGERSIYRLTLRTELDSEIFMEECCNGDVFEYTENGVIYYSSNERKCTIEEYGLLDCKAYYAYEYEGSKFSVQFKTDGTVLIVR